MSDPQAEFDPTESAYLDPFRLDGKVALIKAAGSERGIGREIGLAYAAASASVGLANVDEDGVQAAARAVQATGAVKRYPSVWLSPILGRSRQPPPRLSRNLDRWTFW